MRNISTINLERNKITNLQNRGITNIEDFKKSNLIDEEALKSLTKAPITRTAFDLLNEENSCINNNIKCLNNILKDELTPNNIIELVGLPGTGKTQLCFQLCSSGEAIFITTNKNFCKTRLKSIISKNQSNSDIDHILKQVYVIKIQSKTELLSSLNNLDEFLKTKSVKMLIIDNISYPMRTVDMEDRKIVFSGIFKQLRKLSKSYKFPVVLTNDMTTRVNNSEAYETSSFGDSFYHNINTRVVLTKELDDFKARVVKSTHCGEISVNFDV